MTIDHAEQIRLRAYELWVAEGRPESRDMEYWLRAEQEISGADGTGAGRGGADAGEGNRTAAREFNRQETEFVRAGNIDAKAREAKEAVEGPEGEELRRAEAKSKSRSRGEDPAVSSPNAAPASAGSSRGKATKSSGTA
jgi:hypothetical protein